MQKSVNFFNPCKTLKKKLFLPFQQRDLIQTKIKTLNICSNFIQLNKDLRPKIIESHHVTFHQIKNSKASATAWT